MNLNKLPNLQGSKNNIKLTKCYIFLNSASQIEQNSSLSFVDIKTSRESNKLFTSLYWKATLSEVFTSFESFISKSHKYSLIDTLLYRGFILCSNMEKFHQDISSLKSVLKRNGYPKTFINLCIKKFFDKLFGQN